MNANHLHAHAEHGQKTLDNVNHLVNGGSQVVDGGRHKPGGHHQAVSNWDRTFGGIDYSMFWLHLCHGKSTLLVRNNSCRICGGVEDG